MTQAQPAAMEQLAEAPFGLRCAAYEMLVNRIAERRRLVLRSGCPVEMHHQRERRRGWQIFPPPHDEALGLRIEIALVERRRVDGVEELTQLLDADFDDFGSGRNDVAR